MRFATAVLCLLPVILVILKIRQSQKERRATSKLPFKELRRRPAGESLRIKIISLDEQLNDRVFLLLAMPIALAISLFVIKPFNIFGAVTAVVFSFVWVLAFTGKFFDLLKQRRNCQLGFEGERYVGEELSQLIAAGFEIYHDVPFENFNMDHVLVGPPGVFVIESKTKSKPVDQSGLKEYKVSFDGEKLHWPWGGEDRDIEQVKNNARTFSMWLSSAVGENIEVFAILTLPGWWIERHAPGNGVQILNPKEIVQAFNSRDIKINALRIRQICHPLNEKCRLEIK